MPNTVTISITGDFIPADGFSDQSSGSLIPESLKALLMESDLSIANLECPLTQRGEPIPKIGPHFRGPKCAAAFLKNNGIDLVTLANNHILDYGPLGLKDTQVACHEYDLATVGAGSNKQDSQRSYIREIKGRKIAILNVAENEFASAKLNSPGANPWDLIDVIEQIKTARKVADHVILIIHGGLEYTHFPSPNDRKTMRFLAEQGLSAIIRHHPHYLQGFETWQGTPIFYSLGNFLCASKNKRRSGWFEGMLVKLAISDEGGCSFEVHPFAQSKKAYGITPLLDDEQRSFNTRLSEYSETLANDTLLQHEWEKLRQDRSETYEGLLIISHRLLFRVLRKTKLLWLLKRRGRKRLILLNLIRCEAHREFLIDQLDK